MAAVRGVGSLRPSLGPGLSRDLLCRREFDPRVSAPELRARSDGVGPVVAAT